jgi:hypothetical protein
MGGIVQGFFMRRKVIDKAQNGFSAWCQKVNGG